jgi:hypothetical protein
VVRVEAVVLGPEEMSRLDQVHRINGNSNGNKPLVAKNGAGVSYTPPPANSHALRPKVLDTPANSTGTDIASISAVDMDVDSREWDGIHRVFDEAVRCGGSLEQISALKTMYL